MSPFETRTSWSLSPSRSTSWMPDEPQAGCGATSIVCWRKPPLPSPRNATTVSWCCESSATKSSLPSPSRSVTGTWMAPVRSSSVRGDERRLRPVGRAVLEQQDPADLPPAERGHHDVEVAVAVEVARLRVGDAGKRRRERDHRVGLVRLRAQPLDAAAQLVAGRGRAEVGDEQVEAAVLVEIDDLDVARVRDAAEQPQRAGAREERRPRACPPRPPPSDRRPSSFAKRTFATAAGPFAAGYVSALRSKRAASLPTGGHGSGDGSVCGARCSNQYAMRSASKSADGALTPFGSPTPCDDQPGHVEHDRLPRALRQDSGDGTAWQAAQVVWMSAAVGPAR